MYILPHAKETKYAHEGTTVTVRDLESYHIRQGFVTHIHRTDDQINKAIARMIRTQKETLIRDLK